MWEEELQIKLQFGPVRAIAIVDCEAVVNSKVGALGMINCDCDHIIYNIMAGDAMVKFLISNACESCDADAGVIVIYFIKVRSVSYL